MASNVTQKAGICGWNGLDGSMGPGGHIQSLDLVMGAVSGAQWVQKGSLERVFFSLKSSFLRVVSVTFLASNVTNEAVISN